MFPTTVRFFGQVVSEETIQMWKANRRRMPSDDNSSHAILARWDKQMSITLEISDGSIKDVQSRNTDKIGYKTENKDILAIK